VLRGPQGTLFGKNTTAGAVSVTTKRPRFTPESDLELNFGSLGMVQAKASVTGALSKKIAGRVSFSGTTRDGSIRHVDTGQDLNGLNNVGVRGQLLFTPSDKTAISLAVDHTRQRPTGYAQVVAGVAPTMRPAGRQYPQIAADFGYRQPMAVKPGSRRGLVDDRTAVRPRHTDVDHGMAILELGSVERSRLHCGAGHHRVGRALEATAVHAGSPLRR
jgi:outer membrane receptor protein involved in Fe transport